MQALPHFGGAGAPKVGRAGRYEVFVPGVRQVDGVVGMSGDGRDSRPLSERHNRALPHGDISPAPPGARLHRGQPPRAAAAARGTGGPPRMGMVAGKAVNGRWSSLVGEPKSGSKLVNHGGAHTRG